jgi:hypothetical protein
MPDGKPHDNPVTDTILHGLHPFPKDIESLVIEVHGRNPGVFDDLEWAAFDWENGKHLTEAKRLLHGLVEHHGDPQTCRRVVKDYRTATKVEKEDV